MASRPTVADNPNLLWQQVSDLLYQQLPSVRKNWEILGTANRALQANKKKSEEAKRQAKELTPTPTSPSAFPKGERGSLTPRPPSGTEGEPSPGRSRRIPSAEIVSSGRWQQVEVSPGVYMMSGKKSRSHIPSIASGSAGGSSSSYATNNNNNNNSSIILDPMNNSFLQNEVESQATVQPRAGRRKLSEASRGTGGAWAGAGGRPRAGSSTSELPATPTLVSRGGTSKGEGLTPLTTPSVTLPPVPILKQKGVVTPTLPSIVLPEAETTSDVMTRVDSQEFDLASPSNLKGSAAAALAAAGGAGTSGNTGRTPSFVSSSRKPSTSVAHALRLPLKMGGGGGGGLVTQGGESGGGRLSARPVKPGMSPRPSIVGGVGTRTTSSYGLTVDATVEGGGSGGVSPMSMKSVDHRPPMNPRSSTTTVRGGSSGMGALGTLARIRATASNPSRDASRKNKVEAQLLRILSTLDSLGVLESGVLNPAQVIQYCSLSHLPWSALNMELRTNLSILDLLRCHFPRSTTKEIQDAVAAYLPVIQTNWRRKLSEATRDEMAAVFQRFDPQQRGVITFQELYEELGKGMCKDAISKADLLSQFQQANIDLDYVTLYEFEELMKDILLTAEQPHSLLIQTLLSAQPAPTNASSTPTSATTAASGVAAGKAVAAAGTLWGKLYPHSRDPTRFWGHQKE